MYQLKNIFQYFNGSNRLDLWKSNGMYEENIENTTKVDSNFAPTFVHHHVLPDINSNGHCLINNNIFIPKKVINLYNLYMSYILSPWLRNLNTGFTLNNCLFASVKQTKNVDPDKCKYSGTA